MIGKMKVNVECEGEVGIYNVYDYEWIYKWFEFDFVFLGGKFGEIWRWDGCMI